MVIEQFKPDTPINELREVRIDIPVLGPQRKTVEIIDGMAVAEGDIVLGPAEQFSDVEAADTPEEVVDSVAKSGASALWPDGVVPYEIASGMPNQARVNDAIDHWEENTPIRFVQRSNEDDYVRFFSGSGCWSKVGRAGGRQRISLAGGCGTGAAIHEIAHALGIWHEQSRSDRDVYITVKWENIQDGKKHNFRKHTGANDIGRYDYGSIMHYPSWAFSKDGDDTIVSPEPIGQRSELSEGDIDAAFRMYAPSDAGSVEGVTDSWKKLGFDADVAPDPVVLTGIQTFNGPNPVGVRMRNPSDGNAEVFLEEEESTDSETSHVEEMIGFFATDEGAIFNESAARIGEAGTVNTNQSGGGQWHTVRLDGTYTDPVVFMQIMSHNGSDPSHIRVRDVQSSSFKFQIEEWDYLNQKHTGENVAYLVLEAEGRGVHRLRNGIELDVGTIDSDHNWKSVRSGVASEPVVISQCQTWNGSQAVVTRHRNVGKRGFDLRLQEEEANNDKHKTETIGYLVVAQPEQFEFGVAREEVTHKWSQLDYESDFHEPPATVASIQTFNGPDTADVRMKNPSSSGVEIQIEEETSGAKPANEDCVSLNPQNLEVKQFGGDDWRVVDNGHYLLSLESAENAKRALEIIQSYGFTQHCFVGRPDPGMSYWLTDGNAPGASVSVSFEEDCVSFDPHNLKVKQFGDDDWRVVENGHYLLSLESAENAKRALEIIQSYGFTQHCFVGRPDPGMSYWLAETPSSGDGDRETQHVGEQVAYVATPEGPVYYAPGKQLGEAGVINRNQASNSQWHTINLDYNFSGDPVVFAQLMSKNGGQPSHIRLRNVGRNSFDLQIEEWEYLNQAHVSEMIGYVALETGKYPLPDGGLIEIGTTRTNHSWTDVSLDPQLETGEGNIAVVSRCQTHNGPQAVVTRQKNASPSGFDVRLQEEEARGKHVTETIAYLAAVHEART